MTNTPLNQRPLLFIDTETTGLDSRIHEILEVAVVRCDPTTLEILDKWETRVKPTRIDTAHPKALEVNGYKANPELWDDAPLFDDIADTLAEKLQGGVLVGHNINFDVGFIEAGFRVAGKTLALPYHRVDTVALAYMVLVPRGLDSLSLRVIRPFLGIEPEGAHRAMKDALDTREVYKRISQGEF